EDGIRDRTVTGVQTCALPIFRDDNVRLHEFGRDADNLLFLLRPLRRGRLRRSGGAQGGRREEKSQCLSHDYLPPRDFGWWNFRRSEERRVGKECVCGASQGDR